MHGALMSLSKVALYEFAFYDHIYFAAKLYYIWMLTHVIIVAWWFVGYAVVFRLSCFGF